MGKFNVTKIKEEEKNLTENLAGGEAYQLSAKHELIGILLTSFLKDTFYQKGDDTLAKLIQAFKNVPDKKFAAKAAIYARDKYGMRSVSHVVAGEIAKSVKGEQWTKNFFDKVVVRVDDMTEILSYLQGKETKLPAVPNSLKKGFAKAFDKFDKYQLAKYRGENKGIKLIDLVNLIRPKPSEKNKEALELLVKNELKSFDTWEVKISDAGQKAETEEEKLELKGEAWKELIQNRKIGYFALLRNLRNILQQAPEMITAACEILVDENLISKSRVLPFRFITALDEVKKLTGTGVDTANIRIVIGAINRAVDLSLKNVPKFDGKTLIVLDVSGSMSGQPARIGSLFSAVIAKANINSDVMLFSDNAKYMTVNPYDTTLTIADSINFSSGGTNFHAIFETANKAYERIIILSDMQGWVSWTTPTGTFKNYKLKYSCNPFIYSFDLQGHGTTQFPESKIFCLFGFSDKILETMKFFEQDKEALIKEIENVSL